MPNGAKKSLYLFLTSLLGALMFLIAHRVVFFLYIYMLEEGYIATSMDFLQFLALEYYTLVIWLMLGAWYGIWLGLYWFEKVYEVKSHGGFVYHLGAKYFSRPQPKDMEGKMAEVKERLESNLWQLENLAQSAGASQAQPEPKPIRRRVVRKRAPKKFSA